MPSNSHGGLCSQRRHAAGTEAPALFYGLRSSMHRDFRILWFGNFGHALTNLTPTKWGVTGIMLSICQGLSYTIALRMLPTVCSHHLHVHVIQHMTYFYILWLYDDWMLPGSSLLSPAAQVSSDLDEVDLSASSLSALRSRSQCHASLAPPYCFLLAASVNCLHASSVSRVHRHKPPPSSCSSLFMTAISVYHSAEKMRRARLWSRT